jgi:hypothetical protein
LTTSVITCTTGARTGPRRAVALLLSGIALLVVGCSGDDGTPSKASGDGKTTVAEKPNRPAAGAASHEDAQGAKQRRRADGDGHDLRADRGPASVDRRTPQAGGERSEGDLARQTSDDTGTGADSTSRLPESERAGRLERAPDSGMDSDNGGEGAD